MPAKNRVKIYVENGHYHVYNRGVDKRTIFEDEFDYKVFLRLLKTYLSPPNPDFSHPITQITGTSPVKLRVFTNVYDKVELLCYCLMPNHFHFILKQKTKDGMTKLMKALLTSYAMYFNKKYQRVGHLFQGIYKAAYINKDSYLLQLSRYIHCNPLGTGTNPVQWPYSSLGYYIGFKKAPWINPKAVLSFFKSPTKDFKGANTLPPENYQKFVEKYQEEKDDLSEIENLLIADD
jgi:putative transposase